MVLDPISVRYDIDLLVSLSGIQSAVHLLPVLMTIRSAKCAFTEYHLMNRLYFSDRSFNTAEK